MCCVRVEFVPFSFDLAFVFGFGFCWLCVFICFAYVCFTCWLMNCVYLLGFVGYCNCEVSVH